MLLDDQNNPVALGREIGRGGEARIAQIIGTTEVAKIYHKQPLSPEKGEKLRVLRQLSNDQLKTFTAFPTRLLFENSGKHLVGFAMPHASHKLQIFQLLGPRSRKQYFADKDYRFLCAVALNVAKAFAILHSLGIVIGDVNESGLLVGQDGLVFLIDCDSFQVRQNGRTFLCNVGVPGFIPPELLGGELRVERSVQHDCFGLAVLIFQLLFMGRHPFVGRFTGAGEMPMERAIAEFRFAFAGRSDLQMLPPPDSLQLNEVGNLSNLFERSFLTKQRPEAREWVDALNSFQKTLRCCSENKSHWFPSSAKQCPWCRIENSSGLLLFAFFTTTTSGHTDTVSIGALWAAVDGVPVYTAGQFPSLSGSFSPTAGVLEIAKQLRKLKITSICWFAASFLGLMMMIYLNGLFGLLVVVVTLTVGVKTTNKLNHPLKRNLRDESRRINGQMNQLRGHWEANRDSSEFFAEKARLKAAKEELLLLPAKRTKKLKELEDAKRHHQLQQFLEKFPIADADIEGIGRGRKTTLRAYNVYTAADITYFLKVPGFGPTYMGKLRAWRANLESRFIFDAKKAVDPALASRVEQEYKGESKRLVEILENGTKKLKAIREGQVRSEQDINSKAAVLLARLGQINADLHAL